MAEKVTKTKYRMLSVPGHSTVSRRLGKLSVRLPIIEGRRAFISLCRSQSDDSLGYAG